MTAFVLKLLALSFMLCDHIGRTVLPEAEGLTYIGRLAFPIFAFQLTEGYLKTNSISKYARRLLIFAFISEIPFDLMLYGTVWHPERQNVMWTLLLGLFVMHMIDKILASHETLFLQGARLFVLLSFSTVFATVFRVDYGAPGLLLIVAFHVIHGRSLHWLFESIAMAVINSSALAGKSEGFPVQLFAMLSLPLIWSYNGQSGHRSNFWSWFCYAFYPLHMLLLYGLATFL